MYLLLSLTLALGGAAYTLAHALARREQRAHLLRAQAGLPRRVLWVWERPENLAPFTGRDVGAAELEQTIRLGAAARSTLRRQPLTLPASMPRIAVVRLEADASFAGHHDDRDQEQAAREMLLRTAREPGIAAVQVDFDAKRSERALYRRLLVGLRREMPPGLPLNMTALVSWCATDDWIGGLPVDEATPMFFRMEPDRRRLVLTSPEYRVREPLCAGSVGVSTGEPWPAELTGKRVYVFAERGWGQEVDPGKRILAASRSRGGTQR